MIISVSRRTDIPAFYTEWFMNRLREGYVLTRNPMNYHQVSKVSLKPDVVDAAVFWTKNAKPMLPYLEEIGNYYPYYFQHTLNGYGKDVEPFLPALDAKLETFCKVSEKIGPRRIIWRYDPILIIDDKYNADWHIRKFEEIAKALSGKTDTCVFSFVDIYPKVVNNLSSCNVRACTVEEMKYMAQAFSEIAKPYGYRLRSCAEAIDLDEFGIEHGCCIDGELISSLLGTGMTVKKDPNQRSECGCVESIDIGQYNTCNHGCKYCYANFNQATVKTLSSQHIKTSPLLVGELLPNDKITERKMKLLQHQVVEQPTLF